MAPESLPQESGETSSPQVSNQNDYAEETPDEESYSEEGLPSKFLIFLVCQKKKK